MNEKKWRKGLQHAKSEYTESTTMKKKQAALWIRWVATAVCLCLVATVFLSCRQSQTVDGTIENVTQLSLQAGGETHSGESGELPAVQGAEIPTRDTIPTPTFGPNPVLRPGNSDAKIDVSYPVEQVQYMRTNSTSYRDDVAYPIITVISSRQALEDYYHRYKGSYQLGDEETGFWKLCDDYCDAFFAEQDLVLVLLEEHSGSVRHEVQALAKMEDGTWRISGSRRVPETGTSDMAQWHILMPVPKNILTSEDAVTLDLTVTIQRG